MSIITSLIRQSVYRSPRSPHSTAQRCKSFRPLSEQDRYRLLDRRESDSVFAGVVGQDNAVDALADYLNSALQNQYHETPNKPAILLHGGKSNGKTKFAKLIGKALDRPFVETDPNLLKSTDDIFELARGAAQEAGYPLVQLGTKNGKPFYQFPNLVIFIDEIHGLRRPIVTGLLKALESKDCLLTTRDAYVDCSHVLWLGATTERGELFDAFESRFYKIQLMCYTAEEVAQIVKVNYPAWSMRACQEVALRSGLIVREALELADAVDLNANFRRVSRMVAIDNVSRQRGIDADGMTSQQWLVLEALAQAPHGLNYDQLSRAAQCKVDELKNHVLPPLTAATADRPARIVWTGKNSYITPFGANGLMTRNST